jgi:argininosuccinate lyase
LSHAFSFSTDLERLRQLIPRISVLPLGCGALAGNPFAVDRHFLAKELGFQYLAENSLWGVGDRDFVIEFMMWASLTTTHLSRISEDFIIYSSAEFGFITLSDAYRSAIVVSPTKNPLLTNPSQHWLEYNASKEKSGFARITSWEVWPRIWKRQSLVAHFRDCILSAG